MVWNWHGSKKMNDEEYTREAVELADGFSETNWNFRVASLPESYPTHAGFSPITQPAQWFLDALAAQLVRQAYGHCVRPIELCGPIHYDLHDPMNTIQLIIDSEVLK